MLEQNAAVRRMRVTSVHVDAQLTSIQQLKVNRNHGTAISHMSCTFPQDPTEFLKQIPPTSTSPA